MTRAQYAEVKAFGDVTVGVSTQCLDISKARKLQGAYFGNVALKVNMKLGGVNNQLAQPIPATAAASKEPRIVCVGGLACAALRRSLTDAQLRRRRRSPRPWLVRALDRRRHRHQHPGRRRLLYRDPRPAQPRRGAGVCHSLSTTYLRRPAQIIADLENMAYQLIKRYYGKSKVQPKRIIFYRDGVSGAWRV